MSVAMVLPARKQPETRGHQVERRLSLPPRLVSIPAGDAIAPSYSPGARRTIAFGAELTAIASGLLFGVIGVGLEQLFATLEPMHWITAGVTSAAWGTFAGATAATFIAREALKSRDKGAAKASRPARYVLKAIDDAHDQVDQTPNGAAAAGARAGAKVGHLCGRLPGATVGAMQGLMIAQQLVGKASIVEFTAAIAIGAFGFAAIGDLVGGLFGRGIGAAYGAFVASRQSSETAATVVT